MDFFLEAIEALKIPSLKRSPEDIAALVSLVKQIKFFQNLLEESGLENLTACCEVMTLAEYKAGEFIFKFGEPADTFCIILEGRVSLYMPNRNTLLEDLSPTGQVSEEKLEEKRQGQTLGEISILMGTHRTTSVLCEERTTLAVLSKENYDTLLRSSQLKISQETAEFLSKLAPFKKWTKRALEKLTVFIKRIKFTRNQTVYQEGDLSTHVYIIKSGEFEFSKEHLLEYKKPLGYEEFMLLRKSKPLSLKDLYKRNEYEKRIKLKLSRKREHEVFGVEDLGDEDPHRDHTCTCVSFEAELYAISTKDFKKRVQHSETVMYFSSQNNMVKNWKVERIKKLEEIELDKFKNSFSLLGKREFKKERKSYTPVPDRKLVVSFPCESKTPLPSSLKMGSPFGPNNGFFELRTSGKKKEKRQMIKDESHFKLFDTEVDSILEGDFGNKMPAIAPGRKLMTRLESEKIKSLKRSIKRYL